MNNRIISSAPLNNENAEQFAQILQDRLIHTIKDNNNDLTAEEVIKAASEYNEFTSQYID